MSITVCGGNPIGGTLSVQGSKNSTLPILAACLLTEGKSILHGVPDILDVREILLILRHLGCQVTFQDSVLTVDTTGKKFAPLGDLATTTRGATLFMGAKLATFKKANIYGGGGCALGGRPINYHINGFLTMGATLENEGDMLNGQNMHGQVVSLPYPSVGATQNLILAAVCTPGKTTILGAAREPEICDFIKFLSCCGADIVGMGTSTVIVYGVQKLHGCEFHIMPDRCAAVTYMLASAATGGELLLENVTPFMLYNVLSVFCNMGCKLTLRYDSILCQSPKINGLHTLQTGVHPGIPTDIQPMLCAVLAAAKGETTVLEQVFANRFEYVSGLNRMGANAVLINNQTLYLQGGCTYHGATVSATDLRGGAALILAALQTKEQTTILKSNYIHRGYQDIERVLQNLGAQITKEE